MLEGFKDIKVRHEKIGCDFLGPGPLEWFMNSHAFLFQGDMPEAIIRGSESSQVFYGVIIRHEQPPRNSLDILDGSGVVIDKVDLLVHLDDLEQFPVLKNLHDPVNPFDIAVQKEIPEMFSVVLVNKHDGLGIDAPIAPRRDTAEGKENGGCHKNDGYNRYG